MPLADYKIPGFNDIPVELENLSIDHDQSNGPFGAKGGRGGRDLLRVAGDCPCHRRCGGRALDGNAAQPRDRLSRAAGEAGQAAAGRVMVRRP
jgi:hypothetical protein